MNLTDAEWAYIKLQAERIKRTAMSEALPGDLKIANMLLLTKSLCEAIEEVKDAQTTGDRRKNRA